MADRDRVGGDQPARMAYTAVELAKAFGMSRHAIYSAIARGELRASKVCGGSRFLIPVGAAEEWLERHQVTPQLPQQVDARFSKGRVPAGPLGAAVRELERRAEVDRSRPVRLVS